MLLSLSPDPSVPVDENQNNSFSSLCWLPDDSGFLGAFNFGEGVWCYSGNEEISKLATAIEWEEFIRGLPAQINEEAWALVNPDAKGEGDLTETLRQMRYAVERKPDQGAYRDTLAWALFANGLYDEALVESAKALELADEADKDDYQGYLDRMRAMVEEARADPPTSDLPGDDE